MTGEEVMLEGTPMGPDIPRPEVVGWDTAGHSSAGLRGPF